MVARLLTRIASVVAHPNLRPYFFARPRWCLRRLGGESKREALTRNLERMWQCCPMVLPHRFEQTIVAEPAIGHDQQWCIAKSVCYLREHLNGLLELSSEGKRFTVDLNVSGINCFFHMVKAKGQGQAGPATFDGFQQEPDGDNVL